MAASFFNLVASVVEGGVHATVFSLTVTLLALRVAFSAAVLLSMYFFRWTVVLLFLPTLLLIDHYCRPFPPPPSQHIAFVPLGAPR